MQTPLPIPLPIAFGPHEADWAMVAITAIGALASIVVAASAFITSARAQKTANKTEAARIASDERRRNWEYALRFEDALAAFMADVGEYLVEIRKVEPSAATKPPMDPLVATLEMARLRARDSDSVTMELVRRVFSVVFDTVQITKARLILIDLLVNLRKLQTGVLERLDFEAWVTGLESERDVPVGAASGT